MDKIISFPHMANYHVPVEFLLKRLFSGCEIREAPPITKRTLELGSKHSPDFVCVPFKYNLGNFIEALENGANVLIQAGGGCRYGYYGEIQEQILRDLGYEFDFICFLTGNVKPSALYRFCRNAGCSMPPRMIFYYLALTARMLMIIDRLESYIRENIGFEIIPGEFEALHREFLERLKAVTSMKSLRAVYLEYAAKIRAVGTRRPENCLKVGLVGELYTLMEPFSNFFIEKELAKRGVMIDRQVTASYLIFEKTFKRKKTLRDAGGYLKYHLGADGTHSVATSKILAERGYDGIIHIKPFGCTPEVNAMPMLQKIGADYKIPILYFSFDSQTSETGVKTRLEALCDMLEMRGKRR